ncbi:Fungal specific transcription factor [Colletotrichum higginsianum IMI 349063]|uniref:Fungal specific transcription factor n=1 Tax=Colletotrichum higginsianum (strain IMI 349063) TaxID=759273 RepID=A0A1B7XZZ8_COLHI|nr:Fungal specific transcription factor [Colletotrichum higginsianum IMI 349063]OBR05343.1 Fungal specific transcription factor [Colletotrichum higginsianum IMI 349063]
MSSTRAIKKSAFSCEPCRRRKVKCGGEQPTCNRCAARADECVYKLPVVLTFANSNPTLSYTSRLEHRIKELEAQLAAAKAHGHGPSEPSRTSSPSIGPSAGQSPMTDSHHFESQDEESVSESFKGLKVDDKGAITYHGSTSFFQLPGDRPSGARDQQSTSNQAMQRRERLVANAWQQRALENMSDIPPLFNFIYRPAFTRDMQTLGPYYSHTLMNAVLSHSIRWGRSDPATKEKLDEFYDGGALFGKHARSMVFEELSQGICSIPTVQTLLLLSAQECSVGNSAQAWTYSGLAFRIIDHLGICVDGQRYPGSVQLTDEDVEIRHRLFWSCYFWDKMISLYLGRSPSLQQTSVSPPQIMFDDSSENESWTPFGVVPEGGWKYPPSAAHSTSCFMQMCRLSIVFNEILVHMYDPVRPNSQAEMQDCLAKQEVALRQWWDDLPPHLKMEPASLPALAPPSHIITLNVLYRTFKILLYRPMLSQRSRVGENLQPVQRYLGECVTSATGIIAIFDLFCRSFGISHCVLSLSYSVYISASIFLLQVQSSVDDTQALRRLEYCARILASVKRINPVISSALNLIVRELVSLGIDVGALGLPKTDAIPPMATYGIPQPRPANVPPTSMPPGPEATSSPEQIYNFPFVDTLGPEAFAIDPQVFQTMSSIEPLSVRVGAIDE